MNIPELPTLTPEVSTSQQAWELGIIGWCLQNPEEFFFLSDRMTDWHFSDKILKLVWPKLLDAYQRHQVFPTLSELRSVLQDVDCEPETRVVLYQMLAPAYDADVSGYTGDTISQWVASKEAFELGFQIQSIASENGQLEGELPNFQERLEKIQLLLGKKRLGTSFTPLRPNTVNSLEEEVEEWYGGQPVTTGLHRLDAKLRGGGMRAHTTLIVGPTGTGKTTLALHMALANLRQGKRVVYYALDDNPGELAERLYAHLLRKQFVPEEGWDLNHIKSVLNERIAKEFPGDFWGEWLEANAHSPQDIARDLVKLKQKFYLEDSRDQEHEIPKAEWGQIDLIIIDTADQIRAHRHYKSEWYELEKVFEELAHIPKKFGCPLVLTVQAGQEAVSAAQITERNVGGSFGKNKAAKLILGFAQTYAQTHARVTLDPNDRYVRDNREHMWTYDFDNDRNTEWEPWWLCIIKNTRGRDGAGPVKRVKLPMLVNYGTCRITEQFALAEEQMSVDKKTQREERMADGEIPAAPASSGKRGSK